MSIAHKGGVVPADDRAGIIDGPDQSTDRSRNINLCKTPPLKT